MLKNFMNARAVRSCTDIMKIDVENEASYVDLQKVYLGLDAEAAMANLLTSSDGQNSNPDKIDKINSKAREFYTEVVVQIKNRFSFDSNIFAFSELLDPIQAQDLNPPSLAPLLAKYSLPSWSESLIDREWREQSSVRDPNGEDASSLSVIDYWKLIFAQKYSNGKPKFGSLRRVVEYLNALPFPNVMAKRLFSTLKDVKTNKHNSLSTVTISSTLQTKLGMTRLKVRQNK